MKKWKRHSSLKLITSNYYEYIYEGQSYYFKEKLYASNDDGHIEWEEITEQTYRRYRDNLIKGKNTNTILVEEEIVLLNTDLLSKILAKDLGQDIGKVRAATISAQESIRELRAKSKLKISSEIEYRMFMRIVEIEIRQANLMDDDFYKEVI